MQNETLERIVFEAIADATNRPLDTLSSDTALEAIGLDSLGMAAVISTLEEDILHEQLPSEQLAKFLQVGTIGEFIGIVKSIRVAAATASP